MKQSQYYCKKCGMYIQASEWHSHSQWENRYINTDSAKPTLVKKQKPEQEDYWMCVDHLKKLIDRGEKYKCPSPDCENLLWMRKSEFDAQIQQHGGIIYNGMIIKIDIRTRKVLGSEPINFYRIEQKRLI